MADPTILEIDLTTRPATAVPVDPPVQREPLAWLRRYADGDRRDVIPSWWLDRGQRRMVLGHVVRYAWHRVKYHGVRIPWYCVLFVGYALRGAGRLTLKLYRWVTLGEAVPLRRSAIAAGEHEIWIKEHDRTMKVAKPRSIIVAVVALLILIVALKVFAATPREFRPALAASLLSGGFAALVRTGAPIGRPLIGRAVIRTEAPPLTSDLIIRALESLGIAGISQTIARDPHAIRFPAPIQREGPGWRAEVELPAGITATQVIERRERLAAALARPLGCVWPEVQAEVHPGRLMLWVGDQDMSVARQPAWPLLKTGGVDLFRPIPFGTDQRGKPVSVTLMFASMVCGAVPRMGKSFSVRLLTVAAALDQRAEIHVYDLKGTGDFSSLEPVAHRYRAGDDTDDLDYMLADLRELSDELKRRAKVIRDLPREVCPENKVTPELASLARLKLHPVVLVVDECQAVLADQRVGKEAARICEDLVRRGPALGIISIFATQRPDKDSLPTGISGNAILRFCLRVMGQVENDMVLGTSAYRNGVRATLFSRRDRGIGYLAGEGEDPIICRTYYLDGPGASAVIARARAAREASGLLTGYALDATEQPQAGPPRDFLRDVLACVGPTERRIWTTRLLAALAEWRSDVYEGWTPEQLAAAFKPYGISPKQTHGIPDPGDPGSKTRQGYDLDVVRQAQRGTE